MRIGCIRAEKPAVEVGNEIRSSPIELGRVGGHKSRHEPRDNYTAQSCGNVMTHDQHVPGLWMLEIGIEDDSRECCQDPRPRANRIMCDVEPQNREETIALVARTENPLRNVSASAWLGTRIPKSPPLEAEIYDESQCG